MADTITIGGNMIQIVPAPSGMSDFNITTYFGNGIRCSGVTFVGASTDVLKIRNHASTGVFLIPKLSGNNAFSFIPPQDCFPYIVASEQTQGTPANCIITFYMV